MLSGIIVVVFSFALLVYWFRYSCILILRNATEAAGAPEADGRFHIAEVQAGLRGAAELDPLHASLQRDYKVLVYLIEHAAGLELETIEERLLVIDFRVMQWWYRLVRTAAPEQAREALGEMASVLQILAGRMNARAGLQGEA